MFKMFKLVIDSLKQTCLNVGYSSFTGDNPKKWSGKHRAVEVQVQAVPCPRAAAPPPSPRNLPGQWEHPRYINASGYCNVVLICIVYLWHQWCATQHLKTKPQVSEANEGCGKAGKIFGPA